MMDLTLMPPAKEIDELMPEEAEAEQAAIEAGACVRMRGLGHVHIGAPDNKDQPTVPVYRFTGEEHDDPLLTRYCMATADAAMLLALLRKPEGGDQ